MRAGIHSFVVARRLGSHAVSGLRIAFLAALLAATAGVAPAAAAATVAPETDPADIAGPLDLQEVSIAQQGSRMLLHIATRGSWDGEDITAAPGRSVCVTLLHGDPQVIRGRICATRGGSRPGLSYTPIDEDGRELGPRRLSALIARPRDGVLDATFLPAAAGLAPGAYAWFAQTTWTEPGPCAAGCADRLPDTAGVVDGRLALLGFPTCFGAAARDRSRPCSNPELRTTIEPSVARVSVILKPICDAAEQHKGLMSICAFGADAKDATGSFALVGDSHAASLKTAMEAMTFVRGMHGVSIVRASCPPTAAAPVLPTRQRSQQCATWNKQVRAWIADHDEIGTVFLMAHAGASVRRAEGQSETDAAKAGYREEIRALLRLGRRVVVIRDTPSSRADHLDCVGRAVRSRKPPGPACAQPRSKALKADALASAANSVRSSRVRIVDLTRYFCDGSRCFPVVGGALIHRDKEHITPAFSATLGPVIARALAG